MSRTSDRAQLDDATWKRLAERDLDELTADLSDERRAVDRKFAEVREWARSEIGTAIVQLRAENTDLRHEVADLRESSKWQLRTLVGLLISVVLLLAGVVTSLVIR